MEIYYYETFLDNSKINFPSVNILKILPSYFDSNIFINNEKIEKAKLDSCFSGKNYNYQLLDNILISFVNLGLINIDVFLDLKEILELYDQFNIMGLFLRNDAQLGLDSKDICSNVINLYKEIIFVLNTILKNKNRESINLRYTILYLKYKLNLYFYKNYRNLYYSNNDLSRELIDLKESCKNATFLKGLIYAVDMGSGMNESYKAYVKSSDCDVNYNANKIFFGKGEYWEKFVGDLEMTQRCYKRALEYNTNDFRTWFRYGVLLQKTNNLGNDNKFFDSLNCFGVVIDLLLGKLDSFYLTPAQIHYLFFSIINFEAAYTYRVDVFDCSKARELLNKAILVFDSIDSMHFIEYIYCLNEDDLAQYLINLKTSVDMGYIYDKLRHIYIRHHDTNMVVEMEKRKQDYQLLLKKTLK